MNNTHIAARVAQVRHYLSAHQLHAFIFPSSDPHAGEYVPAHWQIREWVSGFDGSAGTAVVAIHHAALWTDSRYFLAAEEQLRDTPFALMKQGLPDTPSIAQWLATVLPQGATVGADGWVMSHAEEQALRTELEALGLKLSLVANPADELWQGRPELPLTPVALQPIEYAGRTSADKLAQLRAQMEQLGAEAMLVGKLDEVAWLANIRGQDVHCCPVAVAYLWVSLHQAILFVDPCKITPQVEAALAEQGIYCRPYHQLPHHLSGLKPQAVLLDPSIASAVCGLLPASCRVVWRPSPVALAKAVKNEAEIAGFHSAMLRDGVAMAKFLCWLLPAVQAGGQTELSVSRKLEQFRAEQPLYRGLSFDTIAGYGPHGAIVHYEPTPESDAPLHPRGLLLLDSGAQYVDGTTDITRTIALGPLTHQERTDYTLVLRGHIRLAMARFPADTCGTQLDALARYAMWQCGINYLHGTGHGVGSYLNVHEGPHQIRMNHMPTPLQPGMTITNEPGIYRAGCHGVRTENTMLVVPCCTTEFGTFCQLQNLTLCPIDTTPIVPSELLPDEIAYLNAYHAQVRQALMPHLAPQEQEWLERATQPIG